MVEEMGVIEAKIQTVEDIHRLVWMAVANKQPLRAMYKGRRRIFCPHRLGRNRLGEQRVLCYQSGGESESGLAPIGAPENWRCIILEKLRAVEPVDGVWGTAPNHSRPAQCVTDPEIDVNDPPRDYSVIPPSTQST